MVEKVLTQIKTVWVKKLRHQKYLYKQLFQVSEISILSFCLLSHLHTYEKSFRDTIGWLFRNTNYLKLFNY